MKHSLIKTPDRKMKCQFCNNVCIKNQAFASMTFKRKYYYWWECDECQVQYLTSLKGDIDTIKFKSKEENDKFYTIELFLKNNASSINVYRKISDMHYKSKPLYSLDTLSSFDSILELNPIIFPNKLKTYLLFL